MQHDTRELLCTITAATLVISATDDILTPPCEGQYLAANIPQAQYCEVEQQAHTFHIEAPTEFVSIVSDFLK